MNPATPNRYAARCPTLNCQLVASDVAVGRSLRFAFRLVSVAACCVVLASKANAQQSPSPAPPGANTGVAVENNDQDFTRPENLFQLRNILQTAPGSGSIPGTIRTVTTDTTVLRSDYKFNIAPQWTMAFRGDLPFVVKDAVTADDPGGAYVGGLGDADVQAALIDTISARWAAGAGLRIIAPTGTDDLTGGTWRALPIVGARYMLPEMSQGSFFTGLFRYDVSFAKAVPTARDVSNLQFAPTLNVALPNRWFITFYPEPDIRYNFGDPITGQSGRLFVPMDLMVGKNITKTITVSLEMGVPIVKDYPVYDFKTVLRFNQKF
jgi:hypothetical protein